MTTPPMNPTERMMITGKVSGSVESSDRLVEFLYTLMRDHLPTGDVERLVLEVESSTPPTAFTNGWLANYAIYLASRIHGTETLKT